MIDYKNLRSVEQIAQETQAISQGTLEKWRFHRDRMGMASVFVEIDTNVYWDVSRLNEWLYEGKPITGDYRDLRTLRQIIEGCHIRESKLRHWLKYRAVNGLEDAVVVKTLGKHGKLYIDERMFNVWLMMVNANGEYSDMKLGS